MSAVRVLKAAALYFAGVFAVGFLLGAIRTVWVVPALGTRIAELIEAPIMLLVVVFAAREIVRRHFEMSQWRQWLAVGLVALGFLLFVEFTVVLWLRGLSLSEYFANRDPVSGTVYVLLLGAFAAMPLCFALRAPRP
jgi:hypothetical protein